MVNGDVSTESFASPPRSESLVVTALGANKLLMLILAVLLAGAGVAVGVKRKPTWTATSTLQIGANIDPNSPSYAGFVQSETNLATTISRAITANAVLKRIQRRTGLSPAQSARRITATPVPDGAAIEVIATGPIPASAIGLANIAAGALVSDEAPSNFTDASGAIYDRYRAQATVLAQAQARVQQIQTNIANQAGNSANQAAIHQVTSFRPADSSIHPDLVRAQAAEITAKARAGALSAAYTQALETQPFSANLVTPLASAVTANSDRAHKIELLGVVGLAAGLLIGGTLAILREQRKARPGAHR